MFSAPILSDGASEVHESAFLSSGHPTDTSVGQQRAAATITGRFHWKILDLPFSALHDQAPVVRHRAAEALLSLSPTEVIRSGTLDASLQPLHGFFLSSLYVTALLSMKCAVELQCTYLNNPRPQRGGQSVANSSKMVFYLQVNNHKQPPQVCRVCSESRRLSLPSLGLTRSSLTESRCETARQVGPRLDGTQ